MALSTVNISFQKDLLSQIDQLAKDESRSRSELIREAARMYIERKAKWKSIFELGDSIRKEAELKEEDLLVEIKAVRSSK